MVRARRQWRRRWRDAKLIRLRPIEIVVVTASLISGAVIGGLTHLGARIGEGVAPHTEWDVGKKAGEAKPDLALASSQQFAVDARIVLEKKDWPALESTLAKLARVSPQDALLLARSFPSPYNIEAVRICVLAWIETDPSAAFAWASHNDRSVFEDDRFYRAVANAGRFDLGVAALNNITHRRPFLQLFAAQWARQDAQSLIRYIGALSTDDRLAASEALVAVWAQSDFAAAITWAEQEGRNPYERRLMFENAANALVASGELDAVINWADALPVSEKMFGVYRAIAAGLATENPEAALAWMNRIDDPELRAASIGLISTLQRTRPDLAVQLVEGMPNARARDALLESIVIRWARRDLNAAERYVTSSASISTLRRQALLQSISALKP